MDIYSCFLAISILKISDAVFSFQCPVQSHWKHRADNICGSNSSYFCLYDKNNKTFVEFCRDLPDFEAPGKKIIVEGSTQGTLQGAKCSSDFYQPFKFVTNGSYGCVLTKSYCNEEGQVVYGYGTTKNDTLCRCDYTRGYNFTIQPNQTCYCVPSEEDCSCHLKICPPNYNLSQDYECQKVTERNTSFNCESIHSVVLPKGPEISLSTNDSSPESYVLYIADIQFVRVIVLVFVLLVSLYVSIISCVVVLLIKKEDSYRIKLLDSNQAYHESQSLPAKMQNVDNDSNETYSDSQSLPANMQNVDNDLLQYWTNKLQKFVVTKAAEFVYKHIKTEQVVAIIGPTGTGKSVYAYKVAFRLSEEHGYKIIPSKQPADITRYFERGAKQVFVIDDIFGKYDFDEAELVSWGTLLHNVLNSNEQIKVIITSRKSIWHPENCERLRLAFVCDLHSDELKLNMSERWNISEVYLENSDINAVNDKIIKMYPFLPSICSTYSSKDVGTVEDFFTYPIQFIEEEIDNYNMKSPVCLISLAVLAIEQKITKTSFLDIVENDELSMLIKNLFAEPESKILSRKKLIMSHLEALTDTYVKIDKNCFEFIHEEMQNIVLYCIAKTFMNYVLKYSKISVIKNQVQLAGITCIRKEQTLPVIKVTPEHEEAYFTRLAGDVIEGQVNCFGILENNQNEFPIFRKQFLEFLNKKSLKKTGNIKKKNAVGSTVLHAVSSSGYEDYVSYFINLDKEMINEKDANGNFPLHLASMNGRLDIVKLLVENGRNIYMLNNEKLSPFFYACENNSISVVKYLFNLEKDFVKINEKYMKRENKSVLHIACLNGYIEIVKILLDHRATVDIPDAGELTPLHLACSNGQYKTAELLLNYRANVNALDKLERTPVYHACTGDYKDIVELLIKRKANINKSTLNGSTPLHAACEHEIVDIVNILLRNGAKVDVQDREVGAPLHLACRKGNDRIVQILIDNRASINLKTKKNKMRPFHEACRNGHRNVVDILLENGVNYEKQNAQGRTGLFFSCANGHNHIVEIILSRKTDVNRVDQDRITPLHIACMKSHEDVVNTLIKFKANVNVTDIQGETSLYKACSNGNIEIVEILLDREADVKICSFAGLLPVAIAKKRGFNDIVALLDNKHN